MQLSYMRNPDQQYQSGHSKAIKHDLRAREWAPSADEVAADREIDRLHDFQFGDHSLLPPEYPVAEAMSQPATIGVDVGRSAGDLSGWRKGPDVPVAERVGLWYVRINCDDDVASRAAQAESIRFVQHCEYRPAAPGAAPGDRYDESKYEQELLTTDQFVHLYSGHVILQSVPDGFVGEVMVQGIRLRVKSGDSINTIVISPTPELADGSWHREMPTEPGNYWVRWMHKEKNVPHPNSYEHIRHHSEWCERPDYCLQWSHKVDD